MDKVNSVMAYIVLITFIIIAYTVWNNAQTASEKNELTMNETFIFSPPLKQITLVYETPGRKNLAVTTTKKYRGTMISIAEYEFNNLSGIKQVTYEFIITESIINKLDINSSTVNVFTELNGSLVKAGSNLENNSITLTTTKLIPVFLLAKPNENTELSDETIFFNSKTPIGKAFDSVKSTTLTTGNSIILLFVLFGMAMGLILINIERKKKPTSRSSDHSIEEYIATCRREGIHDDEILANLVDEGIKPGHVYMMLKRI